MGHGGGDWGCSSGNFSCNSWVRSDESVAYLATLVSQSAILLNSLGTCLKLGQSGSFLVSSRTCCNARRRLGLPGLATLLQKLMTS